MADIIVPPLPPIKNAKISEQVFTHRSVHARPTHVFEDLPGDPAPDNERYSFAIELLAKDVLDAFTYSF